MTESVDRDLGRLEGRTAAIEHRLGGIEKDLGEVLTTLQQAKGGWRVLLVVGSACAAIGSAVTAVWASFRGH